MFRLANVKRMRKMKTVKICNKRNSLQASFFFLLALQPIVDLYFAVLWWSYSLLAYEVS